MDETHLRADAAPVAISPIVWPVMVGLPMERKDAECCRDAAGLVQVDDCLAAGRGKPGDQRGLASNRLTERLTHCGETPIEFR